MTKYAQFFSGVIGGIITGVVFGVLGCVFAPQLGFNNMFGAEEFACSMSAAFYVMLSLPIGIFLALWVISKLKKYSFNVVYSLVSALVLSVAGLFLRDLMSLYTFLVIVIVYSTALTFMANVSPKQKIGAQKN
jgi:hypothetical protein